METIRSVILVVPQSDDDLDVLNANAEEPMQTFSEPPYDWLPDDITLQSELFMFLIDTLTPVAVVNPDLLLLRVLLRLKAYPPTQIENDPP